MVEEVGRAAAAAQRRAERVNSRSAHDPMLDELRRTGTLGALGYRLLLDIVAIVARARGYPPPDGHGSWDDNAIAEVAHEWLTAGQPGRTLQLLATVNSDAALAVYLETAVVSSLNSQGRRTDRGAYGRAIRRHATKADNVTVSSSPWRYARLAHAHEMVFGGDPETLHDAARAISVDMQPQWRSQRRRAPIGRSSDVRAVLVRVLDTAGAPVLEQPTMVDVILKRFGVTATDSHPAMLDPDVADTVGNDTGRTSYDVDPVRAAARAAWDSLTDDRARIAFRYYLNGTTARDTTALTGISKSAVDRRFQMFRALIETDLRDVEYADQVLRLLGEWSTTLSAGTPEHGSASI